MSKELQRKLLDSRAKLGQSQSQFAETIGVNVRTLQTWEQDQRTPRGFALIALNERLDAILAGSN